MKTQLTWDMLTGDIIPKLIEKIKPLNVDCVVGVSRGGLIPATLIAKKLGLPVETFHTDGRSHAHLSHYKRVVVIEDLVAIGRTLRLIKTSMNAIGVDCKIIPILVDGKYHDEAGDLYAYGVKSDDWVVMPWEDFNSVVENDRGLFRDGTTQYKVNDNEQ